MRMTRSEFRGFVALATVLLLLLGVIAIQQHPGIGADRGAISEPDSAADTCRLPEKHNKRIDERPIKRTDSTGKKKARIKSAPQDLSSPHERPVE